MLRNRCLQSFLMFCALGIGCCSDVVLEVTTPAKVAQISVGTDVCNMSLASVNENEDARQVKCTCGKMDVDVDCAHLGITELPALISFPKGVHIVNFKGNKISDINKDTFYSGRGITELDLSHNRIDFISVDAFKAFKSLMRLDLSHNRIWNLPTNAFQGLDYLRRIDLSFNDLINVFPDLFNPMTELRELILESNPLQELEPKHFEHLQKLELLNLDSTLLKVLPDHVFVFTPKLKILILAGNQLTEVPTEALRVLDHIRVLDLSGNPIEVIRPEAFRGLTGLVTLYLDRMPVLTKIEKYAFGDMIHLQELHCSYNFLLTEIDEKAFVRKLNNEKVALVQLFLRQNALTAIPRNVLIWSDGVEMHLRDNPIHCDCHAEWMVHEKLKNYFQKDVRCASPREFANIALSDMKDYDMKCGLQFHEIVLIICSVVVAVLILVIIVAFLLWRKNYPGYSKPYFRVLKRKHVDDTDYRDDDGM